MTLANHVLLRGLLFDMDGQSMKPVATKGLVGRRYLHYASARPRGEDCRTEDAIRRVPCHVVDELVRKRIGQLLWGKGNAIWPEEVRAVVTRAEIHASAMHIVVRPDAFGSGLSVERRIRAVRLGLGPGSS